MVERIRQLLEARQLSPTQFADAVGVARPIISHILSGRNKPSLEVVQKILAAFPDLSMAWLLNGTPPMWASEAVTPPAAVPVGPAVAPGDAMVAPAAPLVAPVPPPAATKTPNPAAPPAVEAPSRPRPTPRPVLAKVPRFRVAERAVPAAAATTAPDEPGALPAEVPTPAPVATVEAPASAAVPAPAPVMPPIGNDAALAFAQPGKAIRRIVIFYQDGSFADYQPE